MKINRQLPVHIILTLFVLGFGGPVHGQERLAIAHGPYLQQLTENSVMIVWFTNKASVSRVEYGTGDDFQTFPQWGSRVKTVTAVEHGLIDGYTTSHKILITGLQSGKMYKVPE